MPRPLHTRPRTTGRLVLRPLRRRDAAELDDAVRSSLPELRRWLPWAVEYSRGSAQRFIRESMNAWTDARAFDFGIRLREDPDRHLGNASIWWVSRPNRIGEIGYWIRTDAAGRGYATEAAGRLLRVGFEELGLHKIQVRIAVGNEGSRRVAEKLGFVFEGVLRDEVKVGDRWLDHSSWSLLDHEWRRAHAEELR
ncbi:MAG TPA: N-acetyltransferase [Actinobacteria bacterium]|nr:N-acetyltransferase [Actinomycetota bacterium]